MVLRERFPLKGRLETTRNIPWRSEC